MAGKTEIEELKLVISLSDNASAGVDKLAAGLRELGNPTHLANIRRIARENDQLSENLKQLVFNLGSGPSAAVLGFARNTGLAGAAMVSLGYGLVGVISDLRDASASMVALQQAAAMAGRSTAQFRANMEVMERAGINPDAARRSLRNFSDKWLDVIKHGTTAREKVMRVMISDDPGEAMRVQQEFIRILVGIRDPQLALNYIIEHGRRIREAWTQAGEPEKGAVEEANLFRAVGLDERVRFVGELFVTLTEEQIKAAEKQDQAAARFLTRSKEITSAWSKTVRNITVNQMAQLLPAAARVAEVVGYVATLSETLKLDWKTISGAFSFGGMFEPPRPAPRLFRNPALMGGRGRRWSRQGSAAGDGGDGDGDLASQLGLGSIAGGGGLGSSVPVLFQGDGVELLEANTEQQKRLNDFLLMESLALAGGYYGTEGLPRWLGGGGGAPAGAGLAPPPPPSTSGGSWPRGGGPTTDTSTPAAVPPKVPASREEAPQTLEDAIKRGFIKAGVPLSAPDVRTAVRQGQTLTPEGDIAPPPVGGATTTAAGAKQRYNYFQSKGEQPNRANLVTIDTPYGKMTVHKDAAEDFKGFYNDLKAEGAPIRKAGSYNLRQKRWGGGWSSHAHGAATDIDDEVQLSPQMKEWIRANPERWARLKEKWNLGQPLTDKDQTGGKDPAHLEWRGPRPITKEEQAARKAAPAPVDTKKQAGWSPDMPYEYNEKSHRSWYGNFDFEPGLTPFTKAGMQPYFDQQQSDVNKRYGENALQPGSKGWNDYIAFQVDRAAKSGVGYIEFDNLDNAYKRDPKAVREAFALAAGRGLQVLLKNPTPAQIKELGAMQTADGRYVIGGAVFEHGALSPEEFAAARKAAGREDLEATFIRHGKQPVPDVSNIPGTTAQYAPEEYKGTRVRGRGPAVSRPSGQPIIVPAPTTRPSPLRYGLPQTIDWSPSAQRETLDRGDKPQDVGGGKIDITIEPPRRTRFGQRPPYKPVPVPVQEQMQPAKEAPVEATSEAADSNMEE